MKKINWRYAIGELLIVTAGITLAFSLNSIAEKNRENDKRRTYLEGIRSDLGEDIATLDSTTAEIQSRLQILYELIPYLKGKEAGRDSALMRFFTVIDPVKFRPQQSTLQSLKYSGDLSLIDNLDLRASIVAHYDDYSLVQDEYERHMTFSRDYVAEYFMENMDYSRMDAIGPGLFSDQYLGNLIFSLVGIYRMNLQRQEDALKRARSIEKLISDELG